MAFAGDFSGITYDVAAIRCSGCSASSTTKSCLVCYGASELSRRDIISCSFCSLIVFDGLSCGAS